MSETAKTTKTTKRKVKETARFKELKERKQLEQSRTKSSKPNIHAGRLQFCFNVQGNGAEQQLKKWRSSLRRS